MAYDHHRHFCGSIPVETVAELLDYRVSAETLKERMVITKPVSFEDFLKCFELFDYILWDEHKLYKAFQSAVNEVEKDGDLEGAQFICSVDKYNMKPAHVFDIFNDIAKKSTKKIGLILGIKYEKCAEFIENYSSYWDCFKFIDGINFMSREDKINYIMVEQIIEKIKDYNSLFSTKRILSIGMHVGEMGGDENIKFAIRNLGLYDIISHGTRASEDTVKKALDKGILIDVSLVSNLLTSVIKDPSEHGFFKNINHKNVRIVSDDPIIFNNSIENEYNLIDDHIFDLANHP